MFQSVNNGLFTERPIVLVLGCLTPGAVGNLLKCWLTGCKKKHQVTYALLGCLHPVNCTGSPQRTEQREYISGMEKSIKPSHGPVSSSILARAVLLYWAKQREALS